MKKVPGSRPVVVVTASRLLPSPPAVLEIWSPESHPLCISRADLLLMLHLTIPQMQPLDFQQTKKQKTACYFC